MTVAQIVNSDLLYPCYLRASRHFVGKIAFGYFKDSVLVTDLVKVFQIILHFLHQKLRHFDGSIALGRFRVGNDVPFVNPLIGFVDRHRAPFKVEIFGSEC